MEKLDQNVVDSIVETSRKPILLDGGIPVNNEQKPVIFVPDGFSAKDMEAYLPEPLRKRANTTLLDTQSFIEYLKKHGQDGYTVIYANTDFEEQTARLSALIDDHGASANDASWRTHKAVFEPTQTVEWKRWKAANRKGFSQLELAVFIEENMPDIASGIEGMPSGTDMLAMATQFEAMSEKRFKQKLNVQGGGISLEYVDTADNQTAERMRMFDKFSLGLRVFNGGDPYRLDARLRYRQNGEKLTFHYELIRADRVFESAVKDEIKKIADETKFSILFGATANVNS